MSNITFRKITEIIPQRTIPCYGLPKSILEKTIDTNGNECLLSLIDFTYHPSGKILTESHYDSLNAFQYTVSNTYDSQERLISTTDPLGNKKTFAYDSNNNLLSEKGPKNTCKEWIYDKADRPILEKDTGLITKKTYDKLGKVIRSKGPSGNTTEYQYSALGHLIGIKYPDGGIQTKEYDVQGNIIKETDPNGFVTIRKFTARGQPTYILHPDGSEESFRYNLDGTLASQTDKNGATTIYNYDIFQRPLSIQTPLGKTTITYSSFCKLSETNPEGIATIYQYDCAGRLISEKTASKLVNYRYDSLGRLAETQIDDAVYIERFDLLNRLVEKRKEDLSGAIFFSENYVYDELGNRTHIITCEGILETQYNAHNLPIQKISPCGEVTHYSYSYEPQFIVTTLNPKGVQTLEHYDPCHRLLDRIIKNPQIIQHKSFCYDKAGNKTHAIEHIYDQNTFLFSQINRWEYGPCHRVDKIIESDQKETSFKYDYKGRLHLTKKPDGTIITRTYDEVGRLKTLSSKDVHYSYIYDKNHRLVEVEDNLSKKTTKRFYDPHGNLTCEILANGEKVESTYNSNGQKTSLKVLGTAANYTYKAGDLYQVLFEGKTYTYQERNLAGKPTHIRFPNGTLDYAYDTSLRYKSIESPHYHFICNYDSLGNLIRVTQADSLGKIQLDYSYDDLNQLLSENSHTYTYDSLYNRLSKDALSYQLTPLCQVTSDGVITYDYDLNGNLIRAGRDRFTYDSLDEPIPLIEILF